MLPVLIFTMALLAAIAAAMFGAEATKAQLCQAIRDGINEAMAEGRTYTMEPEVYNFYAECTEEDFTANVE